MNKFRQSIIGFFEDEEGATAIEYALIAALIAVAIIAAVRLVGGNLTTTFNNISSGLNPPAPSSP